MRLIDIDKAFKNLSQMYEEADGSKKRALRFLLDMVLTIPTISPDSLRPKGRWIWCKNHYECSNCRGSRFHDLVLGLDAQYCGRCGADMREERHDCY